MPLGSSVGTMHLAFLAPANCLESVSLIFSLQDTGGIPHP